MKRFLIDGKPQGIEAERIVVDRVAGTIIGYIGKQEVFAIRGVDFENLNYTVEGGEDAPEEDKISRLEAELAAAREENLLALEAIAELYEMMLAQGGGSA